MVNPPSRNQLPRHLDPRKFAQQGIEVSGQVEVKQLNRACSVLASEEGVIDVTMAFGISEEGFRKVSLELVGVVQPLCQRCLKAMSFSLSSSSELVILWQEDDAKSLPEYYDPWVVGEGQTDIYELVEDELLLGIPMVAYHDEPCIPAAYLSSGEDEVAQIGEQKAPNPFQVLEQLKGELGDGLTETSQQENTNTENPDGSK